MRRLKFFSLLLGVLLTSFATTFAYAGTTERYICCHTKPGYYGTRPYIGSCANGLQATGYYYLEMYWAYRTDLYGNITSEVFDSYGPPTGPYIQYYISC